MSEQQPLGSSPICDILLHSRGDLKDDNLIAVEMKKDYASDERKQSDRERLQALTLPLPENGNPDCVCGYQIGYYLEIHIGNGTLLIEGYREGKLTNTGHEIRSAGSFSF